MVFALTVTKSGSDCRCVSQALKLAGGQVLEPVMSMEVTVGEEYLGSVLGDLAQRRGTVRDIQSRHDNKVLLASVPLAEMMVSEQRPNGHSLPP